MSWMRPLGSTGMQVSALGLGTVKLGRDQGVKYPQGFIIPDDRAASALLGQARELGINLIDTAPAYGNSEQRLGELLRGQRQHWLICSKVGEEFEQGESRYDFSPEHTRASVDRSLRRLNTDVIDIVLVHSDGDDLQIFEHTGAIDALHSLKQRGLIRAHGMSSKTVQGGLRVVAEMDVVMATANLTYNEELPVLQAAAKANKGVLIKKGLMSGHLSSDVSAREAMKFVFEQPGVSGMIVGTINPQHLRDNVRLVEDILR